MRFIRKASHPGRVRHFDYGAKIAANTIISRVIHQNCNSTGMIRNGFRHMLPPHPQGNAQILIHIGVYVYRNRTAQNQGIDNTLMYIAGKDDLIPPLAGG